MSTPVVYTLLIYSSRSPDRPLPAAEEEAALVRHRALQAEAQARGDLLAVARLDAAAPRRSVGARGPAGRSPGPGADPGVDGPYIESKEWLVGYYLLRCDDEQAALERARQICIGDEIRVEVHPVPWHRVS